MAVSKVDSKEKTSLKKTRRIMGECHHTSVRHWLYIMSTLGTYISCIPMQQSYGIGNSKRHIVKSIPLNYIVRSSHKGKLNGVTDTN